ncbi:MAG: DUF2933 domain-containing protein [Firmicutes bacterium]|nr:DUF2933 domain-containing protein [Bacillota bacterium]
MEDLFLWAILLLCPLMHLFMMRKHGNHSHDHKHKNTVKSTTNTEKKIH